MTYLVNDNVQAAMWMYYAINAMRPITRRIETPLGFAEFREQRDPPPRSVMNEKFNIVRWAKMPRGGHFAAWEEPRFFADEVAAFFRLVPIKFPLSILQ
jgi:pimeloyl-ACP methyl ester carboxylesterase